jgi:hypothetical protein
MCQHDNYLQDLKFYLLIIDICVRDNYLYLYILTVEDDKSHSSIKSLYVPREDGRSRPKHVEVKIRHWK